MKNKDFLILVDDQDEAWGKLEKELVHEKGLLHRAFSVFIFNSKGEMLLQQRADSKYHSGGLWSNTCCSHPRWGQEIEDAIELRLEEEMGLHCSTEFAFTFLYKTDFPNGLKEHELDHVYIGVSDEIPSANPLEVKSWKYLPLDELRKDIFRNPDHYTYWFKLILERVISSQQVAHAV